MKKSIITSLATLILFVAQAAVTTGPCRAEEKGPDWLIVLTPTGGWLNNETTFRFKVPQGASGEIEYEEHDATLADDGWGGGFTMMGFYKWVALTNVFFVFPNVNQSALTGNITYLSLTIPTPWIVEPYLGTGFVVVSTDTDYESFKYTLRQDYSGRDAVGYADFTAISVDNRVIAPFPKIGLKLKIPVQHWYVTPFYSYMYEFVTTHARSPGGDVQVYFEGDREAGRDPQLEVEVPSFDTVLNKQYGSHLVGADFFVDFHYFLQMRGKVYYNTNYDLWTVRLIGSMMINKWFGLSAYFEYSQKITVTNTYFLVGPAFVISPPGYFDEMMKKRKAKK